MLSVNAKNALRDGKINATSYVHELWSKREEGLEILLSQQHLCVGCAVLLHTLQLSTALQVQGWEGQTGGCQTFPKWLFDPPGAAHQTSGLLSLSDTVSE